MLQEVKPFTDHYNNEVDLGDIVQVPNGLQESIRAIVVGFTPQNFRVIHLPSPVSTKSYQGLKLDGVNKLVHHRSVVRVTDDFVDIISVSEYKHIVSAASGYYEKVNAKTKHELSRITYVVQLLCNERSFILAAVPCLDKEVRWSKKYIELLTRNNIDMNSIYTVDSWENNPRLVRGVSPTSYGKPSGIEKRFGILPEGVQVITEYYKEQELHNGLGMYNIRISPTLLAHNH